MFHGKVEVVEEPQHVTQLCDASLRQRPSNVERDPCVSYQRLSF